MKVTFHNVSISIEAESEWGAYAKLQTALSNGEGIYSYCTDTFTTDSAPDNERSTSEVMYEDVLPSSNASNECKCAGAYKNEHDVDDCPGRVCKCADAGFVAHNANDCQRNR